MIERSKPLHYKIVKFLNPKFRLYDKKNSICTTVLELSCLNQQLENESCWMK